MNKKLAVVTCGWHYASDFYRKVIEQKIPDGWDIDYFCASHRDPKFAWEEKKKQVDDIVVSGDDLFQIAQKLDKKLYDEEVTIDGLEQMGWVYKEYPNTVGGWGAHNQWLEENDYREYDVLFFCDDDLFFINSEITKSKIIYSWFVINLDKDAVNSWRYKFVGNILNGLKQYIDILNHIERKRGKHESSNYRK